MAPWPEQGNELKSIDKVNEIRSSSFDETQHPLKTDQLDEKGKPARAEDPQDPQVLGLDEGQLKALLDEAITYKNPKDREGKSELFKELLLEVEADDKSGGAVPGAGGVNVKNPIHSATSSARFNRNHRRSQGHQARLISERNRSGGSLQNLVQACSSELESGPGYSRRRGAGVRNNRGSGINVSARQREGGSLPSNVNHVQGVSGTSTSLFDEYKRSRDVVPPTDDKLSSESGLCTDYSSSTNTHSRKTSSTWGDEEGIELEEMRAGARTYTSRATLEVCTDPATTSSMSSVTNPSVDTAVLFPLKSKCAPNPPATCSTSSGDTSESHTTPSASSYNYVRLADMDQCTSSLQSTGSQTSASAKNESSGSMISTLSIPPQPISLGSAAEVLVGTPQVSMLLSRDYHTLTTLPHAFHLSDLFSEPLHAYTSSGYISSADKKSGYDENGNTLSQSDRTKKTRKHKAKNEKKTYLAETVDGFRGTLKLHELLLFIENEPGSKKKNKMKKKATDDSAEHSKKRKGKDKLTKCNSMEEISKTKLEDLTSTSTSCQNQRLRPKKQVTLDDEELGWREDDNSVSADEGIGRKRMKEAREKERDRERTRTEHEEAEFRLVQTKKHRRRKRRSSHNEQISQSDVFRTARSSPERPSPHHRHHRTSSMPPSDRSDCSDLDSVHSLPVTSQHNRRGGTNTPSSGPDSHEYASASTSPSGVEVNYGGVMPGDVNHSVAKGRQRVTSSPGVTSSHQPARSSSCTFGTSSAVSAGAEEGGGKLVKAVSCHASSQCVSESSSLTAVSCHASSQCVNESSSMSGLTKSTPNSTLDLVTSAAPVGRTNTGGAKSVSPERRRKSGTSAGVSHSQSSHAALNTNEDCSSPIGWTEGDYPPLPINSNASVNTSSQRHSEPRNSEPRDQRQSELRDQRQSEPRDQRHTNTNRDRRNSEPKELSNGPPSEDRRVNRRLVEPVVCNGPAAPGQINGPVASGQVNGPAPPSQVNGPAVNYDETVETVTLSLNNNKHRAPSPPDNLNNNNCCDVFVEFSLPPPPPSSVNVTVEKTVIIRNQSLCTGEVSESVSLIIPPPNNNSNNSNNRKSPRNHSISGTINPSPLPPVILLDSRKKKRRAAASLSDSSDLTFGFEINRTLLDKDRAEVAGSTLPRYVARDGDDQLGDLFNYVDIVNFVENSWKDVMKGFSSQKTISSRRVDYYSHPSTANTTQPSS